MVGDHFMPRSAGCSMSCLEAAASAETKRRVSSRLVGRFCWFPLSADTASLSRSHARARLGTRTLQLRDGCALWHREFEVCPSIRVDAADLVPHEELTRRPPALSAPTICSSEAAPCARGGALLAVARPTSLPSGWPLAAGCWSSSVDTGGQSWNETDQKAGAPGPQTAMDDPRTTLA